MRSDSPLPEKIKSYLDQQGVDYQKYTHPPADTCELAAKLRQTDLAIGGKSLFVKAKKTFSIFTLSAAQQADSNKMRKILKSQKLRFASPEELWELVGVTKGSLPPLGRPLLPFDLYLDKSFIHQKQIAFNAGISTLSFVLTMDDYLKLVDPIICEFSK